MIIFYIDECGDHSMVPDPAAPGSLKPGVSDWFVLAAVGIPDASRKPLAEEFFELKQKHFGPDMALHPWGESEIKGRFLFRVARSAATGNVLEKPDAYAALDTTAKVDALLHDLGMLFVKYRPLTFAVAIDKKELMSRKRAQPPLGAAYTYLEQRVALSMDRLFAGEAGILVADQQTQHEKFFRSGQLNTIRDEMTKKLPMQPNFNLVLDKPLWIDTELSTWDREIIQLADIVAYSVTECMKRGKAPAEACFLWKQIRSTLAVQWNTGDIYSGGLSIYPKPATYPVI